MPRRSRAIAWLLAAVATGAVTTAALAGDIVLRLGDQTIVGSDGKFRLKDGSFLVVDPKTEFLSHLRGGMASPVKDGNYVHESGRTIPVSMGRVTGATVSPR